MQLTLTAEQERKIARLAREAGTSIPAYLDTLVARLPEPEARLGAETGLAHKLRRWQAEDGSPLFPDTSAAHLFARWRREDAALTSADRQREYDLWVAIEAALAGN